MVGWAGTAFCVSGAMFTAYKRRCGFLFTLVGCALWGAQGIILGLPSLVVVEAVFIGLSLFGWWKWGVAHE
jgi:hypothetical protein